MRPFDGSIRVLVVKPKSSVELRRRAISGEKVTKALDSLMGASCPMTVELGDAAGIEPYATYKDGSFRFYNCLSSTGETASSFGVETSDIIGCINHGLLSYLKDYNGYFWLIVKDSKFTSINRDRIVHRGPLKLNNGTARGLNKKIRSLVEMKMLSKEFSLEELKSVLSKENWDDKCDIASLRNVLNNLVKDDFLRVLGTGRLKNRCWNKAIHRGVKGIASVHRGVKGIASAVSPSEDTVSGIFSELVEKFSDMLVNRVSERAKEKLGV